LGVVDRCRFATAGTDEGELHGNALPGHQHVVRHNHIGGATFEPDAALQMTGASLIVDAETPDAANIGCRSGPVALRRDDTVFDIGERCSRQRHRRQHMRWIAIFAQQGSAPEKNLRVGEAPIVLTTACNRKSRSPVLN
jgi:hypothetical protein